MQKISALSEANVSNLPFPGGFRPFRQSDSSVISNLLTDPNPTVKAGENFFVIIEARDTLGRDDAHASRVYRPGLTLRPTEACVVRGRGEAVEPRPSRARHESLPGRLLSCQGG